MAPARCENIDNNFEILLFSLFNAASFDVPGHDFWLISNHTSFWPDRAEVCVGGELAGVADV